MDEEEGGPYILTHHTYTRKNVYKGSRKYGDPHYPAGGAKYSHSYYDSTFGSDAWIWCIVIGIFFVFLVLIAIGGNHASSHGGHHGFGHGGDDDEGGGGGPIVRRRKIDINEDPQESKQRQASKILKSSIRKNKGDPNNIPSLSSIFKGKRSLDEFCPSGTIPASGAYSWASMTRCMPNYTIPVAIDHTIINEKTDPCDGFSSYACGRWKGAGYRGFTFSSMTNTKIRRLVENLDAIGEKLVWNVEKTVTRTQSERDNNNNIKYSKDSPESIATEESIFSRYVGECHEALSNIPEDMSMIKRSDITKQMLAGIRNVPSRDWTTLGKRYGQAACMGINPLMHVRVDRDIFNNSLSILYVQPKGMIGIASESSSYHEAYIDEACVSATSYLSDDENDHSERTQMMNKWGDCSTNAIKLENKFTDIFSEVIGSEDKEDMDHSYSDYKKEEVVHDMIGKAKDLGPFFTSAFFKGFTGSLLQCKTTPESPMILVEQNKRSPDFKADDVSYWVEYKGFFDKLYPMVRMKNPLATRIRVKGSTKTAKRSESTTTKEDRFEQFKDFLTAAVAADNLEVLGIFAEKELSASTPEHVEHLKSRHKATNLFNRIPLNRGVTGVAPPSAITSISGVPVPYVSLSKDDPRVTRLKAADHHPLIREKNINTILYDGNIAESFVLFGNSDWSNYAWYTCMDIASVYLPEIVDNSFASFTTTPKDRAVIAQVIDNVLEGLLGDIQDSSLVKEETKVVLADKAANIKKRIAVPWESNVDAENEYSGVYSRGKKTPVPVNHDAIGITGKDFYADTIAIRRWAMSRDIDQLEYSVLVSTGKKSMEEDKTLRDMPRSDDIHFLMSTTETNAYYDPLTNDINILAGIMKPPFFHQDYTPASLYATIGTIIGHEMSHGFDANGVYFNKYGDLDISKISEEERNAYESREQCFVNQYTDIPTNYGNTVDGKQTLSENIADNAGASASWRALRTLVSREQNVMNEWTDEEKMLKELAKEFSLAYAQMWCSNAPESEESARIAQDVHSPAQVRIDRTLSNLIDKETGKSIMELAWSCKRKDLMVANPQCKIW